MLLNRKALHRDIYAYLKLIVDENTTRYRTDLDYDLEMFRKSLHWPDTGLNRYFLWLSRECGTNCQEMRRALNQTEGSSYLYYHGEDNIVSFIVKVEKMEGDRLIGSAREVDFSPFCDSLKKRRYKADQMIIQCHDGNSVREVSAPVDGWEYIYVDLAKKYDPDTLFCDGYTLSNRKAIAEEWALKVVRDAFGA